MRTIKLTLTDDESLTLMFALGDRLRKIMNDDERRTTKVYMKELDDITRILKMIDAEKGKRR